MARTGVTREQVFEVAGALVLEGKSPTVVAVRTRLGGGSPNTITPFLAEWKALSEAKASEGLPVVPEQIEALMRQIWGLAWKEARGQLEAEREALNTARESLEKERTEMLAEITRLDHELEVARDTLREKDAALEAERRAHEQAKSQAREAQALADEREKRIASLEAELEDEKQGRGEAEKALIDLRVEVATLTERAAHVDELRQLVHTLQAQQGREEGTGKSRTAPKRRRT